MHKIGSVRKLVYGVGNGGILLFTGRNYHTGNTFFNFAIAEAVTSRVENTELLKTKL